VFEMHRFHETVPSVTISCTTSYVCCPAALLCHAFPVVLRSVQLSAWADALSQQQLFGVLLVMADSYSPHVASFQLLLNCWLLKQQIPQTADGSSHEATPLQSLLVQLLMASLHEQYSLQETCAAVIVGAIRSLPPDARLGRCPSAV
jgi:hypothetical protein